MMFRLRTGYTIVELLVVIGIMTMMIGILLPAVQSAREAARRNQCEQHLRQLGMAVLVHENQFGHFPTNGHGSLWSGDSASGFGMSQPGGWIFNSLPFIEAENVRALGQSGTMGQLHQTPLAVLHCPSRRAARLYPWSDRWAMCNSPTLSESAKCDFAINGGDQPIPGTFFMGPPCAANSTAFRWPDTSTQTGIGFVRSRIRASEITDGTSNTFLLGEKYVRIGAAVAGQSPDFGDYRSPYIGDGTNIRRWTAQPPARDRIGYNQQFLFGSRHPAVCNMVTCDGAIRAVHFGIDAKIFRQMGNRLDGNAL